jgi:serine/threonine protein kinase
MERIRELTFSELKKRIEKIPKEKIFAFVKSQLFHELDFITQYEDTREIIEINNVTKGLKNFDINRIIKLSKSEFFSEKQVEFFKYFSKSILRFDKRNYRFYSKLRYWFRNFRKVSSGSYGSVYSASLRGSKEKLFVFKFTKSEYDDPLIEKSFTVHEYFVSHYFINGLRKKCPNFSMTFGLLECSSPDLVFGTPFEPITCIVYENIHPSKTLYNVLRKGISLRDFLCILIQICLSLYLACSEFGFTHNDLHLGNVLIKEYKQTLYIPYYYKGRKIYVSGKYLAVIIDYGMSRIEMEKNNFGPFGIPRNSINEYYKPYPVKDIFSILVTSYIQVCEEKKGELCDMIKEILNLLISKKTTYKQFYKIPDLSLFYPYFEEIGGVKGIEYVLDYIFENLDQLLKKDYAGLVIEENELQSMRQTITQNSNIILDCNYTTCHTLKEIYDITYRKLPISDILYYLDLRNYNPNIIPSKKVIEYNLGILMNNINRIVEYYSYLKEISILHIEPKDFIEYYILSKDTIELYDALSIFTEDSKDKLSKQVQSLKTKIDSIKNDVNIFVKDLMKFRDKFIFEDARMESELLAKLLKSLPAPVL